VPLRPNLSQNRDLRGHQDGKTSEQQCGDDEDAELRHALRNGKRGGRFLGHVLAASGGALPSSGANHTPRKLTGKRNLPVFAGFGSKRRIRQNPVIYATCAGYDVRPFVQPL
jgi:hypothetical protein